MKKQKYYVVDVSFRGRNPVHRAIAYHLSDGHVTLFGSYEDLIEINVEHLNEFKVIEEIKSMK